MRSPRHAVSRQPSGSHSATFTVRGICSDRRGIPLNLPDRARNLVHVLIVAQKRKLRNPDGLPRRTLRVRELLLQELMLRCRLRSAQALAVFATAEAIQVMQWRIARLRRNPLGIQCGNEVLRRNPGELFRIHMEDVRVLTIARASRIALVRRDARDFCKQTVKKSALAVAMKSLFFQSPQLHVQNCSLPLAEPVIGAIDEVAVEPLA